MDLPPKDDHFVVETCVDVLIIWIVTLAETLLDSLITLLYISTPFIEPRYHKNKTFP